MRINLETQDIEAFAAVASILNYKAAAARLNMSPSSLSRRVQKLEEQLGVKLFDRTTRQVRLTLGGKQLLERATGILDNLDETVLALRGETASRVMSVSIGAIPSIAHLLLPKVLREFHTSYPGARVSVRDMTTEDVLQGVGTGELAFGITSFVQHDPELEFRHLLRGRIVLAIPKDHELARRTRLRWTELEHQTLISTWKGSGIRMVMDVDLARTRGRLSAIFEVQQMYTALRFVEEGLGVAPAPDFFLGKRQSENIHVARLTDPEIRVDLGALVSRRHRMSAAAATLLASVTKACKRL